MDIIHIFISVVALVAVFLFSIKKFSHQIELLAGNSFKQSVRSLTSTPLKGTVIGTFVTALLHSSTATTVMTIGLVHAGVLSFYNSLGVIFGANIGTSLTSQMFALDLSIITPYIIILGFFLSMVNTRFKKYGKIVFYFGLMLFCLSYISQIVEPLQHNLIVAQYFAMLTNSFTAIVVGIVFATLFQSSTVTSGIAIILASQGLIGVAEATYIIFGANIGTTSTALILSAYMDRIAKKTAMAHLLFNILGVAIMLPIMTPFIAFVELLGGSVSQQIVNAHIIFNLISTVIALIFVHQFADLVEKITPRKAEVLATPDNS